MPTFILLTKLSPSVASDAQTREIIGRDWFSTVHEKCPEVKWLEHYALLGQYDFMDIFEAPNEEIAAKVSMITMSKGAVKTETITAIPYQRYLEIFRSM